MSVVSSSVHNLQQNLTTSTILCCICGISIKNNPTNMCVSCLHDQVDITKEINTKNTLHSCRSCGRFLGPPWQTLALESKELMILCLRKIAGLNKVKLIDAVWIWTEPHSMRLKIKLTIQKEIMHNAVLQQATVVEFAIRNQQCKHCEASYAQGAWKAVVQVRQRVSHKRTFFYLEQLILKHDAHSDCIKIVTFRDGMDFYFKDKNQGLKFIDFLQDCVPLKMKYSRKLISADHTNNTGDFKHNYLIDIAPICKDDLVILPRDLASKQSNISPLVLVKKISAGLHMVDPMTAERTEINSEKYWRYEFKSVLSSRQLIKYVILSVEPVLSEQKASARMKRVYSKANSQAEKTRAVSTLAEVVVARERDFGVNDTQFICITHLGPLLAPGDTVMGYDLTNINLNTDSDDTETLEWMKDLPDLIIVRKCYDSRGERIWKLKNLEQEVEDVSGTKRKNLASEYDADLEDFMQQVEGDRELRAQMNLYRRADASKKASKFSGVAGNVMDDDSSRQEGREYDPEEVRLDELLEEMSLHSDEDAEESEQNNARHIEEFRILSEGDASAVPALEIPELASTATGEDSESVAVPTLTPFDASAYQGKDFKFT